MQNCVFPSSGLRVPAVEAQITLQDITLIKISYSPANLFFSFHLTLWLLPCATLNDSNLWYLRCKWFWMAHWRSGSNYKNRSSYQSLRPPVQINPLCCKACTEMKQIQSYIYPEVSPVFLEEQRTDGWSCLQRDKRESSTAWNGQRSQQGGSKWFDFSGLHSCALGLKYNCALSLKVFKTLLSTKRQWCSEG